MCRYSSASYQSVYYTIKNLFCISEKASFNINIHNMTWKIITRDYNVFILVYRNVSKNTNWLVGWLDFNSLWPNDAIWRQRSESTLVQATNGLSPNATKPLPEPMLT